jgi:hypothetical protein
VGGTPLPITIITPSDMLERRATTLEIRTGGYRPRALYTDSVVAIDAAGADRSQKCGGSMPSERRYT